MAITYIPREESALKRFQEGFSPYLQLAFQAMLKRKLEEQQAQQAMGQFQRPVQDIQLEAKQQYGQPFYTPQGMTPEQQRGRIETKADIKGISTVPPEIQRVLEMGKKYPGLEVPLRGGATYTAPSTQTPWKPISKEEQLSFAKEKEVVKLEAAGERAKLPTSEMRNLATEAKSQLLNVKALRKEASKLPGGYSGIRARMIGVGSRGKYQGDVLMYERKIPAYSAGLYRAMTGDKRLSDRDAGERAKPLLWDTSVDTSLREPMFQFVEDTLQARINMIEKGQGQWDEETKSYITDFESVKLEAKRIQAKRAGYSDEEIDKFLYGGQ